MTIEFHEDLFQVDGDEMRQIWRLKPISKPFGYGVIIPLCRTQFHLKLLQGY
jgi:hypothetical protein